MPAAARTAACLLGAVLVLGAAACGGGGSDDAAGSDPSPTSGSSVEVRASQEAADSAHNEADVRFAQEMVPHHAQAVEMARLAADHDLDPQVRRLAERIGSGQSREIELMTGWLRGWGEEVPEAGAESSMRGMLSDDELDRLRSAEDPAFESLWLGQMTQHHRGAIPMAQQELRTGENPAALDLAREIIETQKAELYEMGGLIGQ